VLIRLPRRSPFDGFDKLTAGKLRAKEGAIRRENPSLGSLFSFVAKRIGIVINFSL
jgi:hypothetical protein